MSTAFVVVLRLGRVSAGVPELPPGAVLTVDLGELGTCAEPDDRVAVVVDAAQEPTAGSGYADRVSSALTTFTSRVGTGTAPATELVVADVHPVTDTLKLVESDGALCGTADREHHRYVTAPLVTRLGALRAARRRSPVAASTAEILAALVAAGATVVANGANGG